MQTTNTTESDRPIEYKLQFPTIRGLIVRQSRLRTTRGQDREEASRKVADRPSRLQARSVISSARVSGGSVSKCIGYSL